MVKVTFSPWEEVVIHEPIQYTYDELVYIQSLGVQAGSLAPAPSLTYQPAAPQPSALIPLYWAEGVIFTHVIMQPTEDVIREQLRGIVHWVSIVWALMPSYQNIVVVKDTNVRIPIINASQSETFCNVARALKKGSKEDFTRIDKVGSVES
ncbi:hypothetical protein MUP77_11255 [Candidatus Bathyarchaeota archaeon]|nr:hypothetical protein [Candidatus Bathyarchaeota archaeon]